MNFTKKPFIYIKFRKVMLLLGFAITFSLSFNCSLMAQVSLQVVDAETKKPIPYATGYNSALNYGKAADADGIIKLPANVFEKANSITLQIRSIGYLPLSITINNKNRQEKITVKLKLKEYQIEGISIIGKTKKSKNDLKHALKLSRDLFNSKSNSLSYNLILSMYLMDKPLNKHVYKLNYNTFAEDGVHQTLVLSDSINILKTKKLNELTFPALQVQFESPENPLSHPYNVFSLNPLKYNTYSSRLMSDHQCKYSLDTTYQGKECKVINVNYRFENKKKQVTLNTSETYIIERSSNLIVNYNLASNMVLEDFPPFQIDLEFRYIYSDTDGQIKSFEYSNYYLTTTKQVASFSISATKQ